MCRVDTPNLNNEKEKEKEMRNLVFKLLQKILDTLKVEQTLRNEILKAFNKGLKEIEEPKEPKAKTKKDDFTWYRTYHKDLKSGKFKKGDTKKLTDDNMENIINNIKTESERMKALENYKNKKEITFKSNNVIVSTLKPLKVKK